MIPPLQVLTLPCDRRNIFCLNELINFWKNSGKMVSFHPYLLLRRIPVQHETVHNAIRCSRWMVDFSSPSQNSDSHSSDKSDKSYVLHTYLNYCVLQYIPWSLAKFLGVFGYKKVARYVNKSLVMKNKVCLLTINQVFLLILFISTKTLIFLKIVQTFLQQRG